MSTVPAVSPARRREVVDALRRGTVPQAGLDLFAVGLDRFVIGLDEDLAAAARCCVESKVNFKVSGTTLVMVGGW